MTILDKIAGYFGYVPENEFNDALDTVTELDEQLQSAHKIVNAADALNHFVIRLGLECVSYNHENKEIMVELNDSANVEFARLLHTTLVDEVHVSAALGRKMYPKDFPGPAEDMSPDPLTVASDPEQAPTTEIADELQDLHDDPANGLPVEEFTEALEDQENKFDYLKNHPKGFA